MSTILEQFSNEMAGVSTRTLRSLAQIRRGGRGIGSGAIWHANGLIVTNAHVVGERGFVSNGLKVGLPDGRELPGRVLAVDTRNDLAVVQVEASGLSAFDLGDSRNLQAGEMVWALGFPWGVHGGATIGTVIGVGNRVGESGGDGREWLAASLHLRPGHSGGPMVDAQGRLVGINSMMNGPDVGVAVPIHIAQRFFEQSLGHQHQSGTVMV